MLWGGFSGFDWDKYYDTLGIPNPNKPKETDDEIVAREMLTLDSDLAQLTLIGPEAGAELREMVYGNV